MASSSLPGIASCAAQVRWYASAVSTAPAFARSSPMPPGLAVPSSVTSRVRRQLITEALNLVGAEVLDDTESGLIEAAGLAEAIDAIFAPWRQVLVDSNFTLGCPVAATVVDASGNDQLRQEARALLAQMRDSVSDALVRFGVPKSTADDDASVLLAALEGALILSRAEQSTQPLDTVQRFFTTALTSAAHTRPAAAKPVRAQRSRKKR